MPQVVLYRSDGVASTVIFPVDDCPSFRIGEDYFGFSEENQRLFRAYMGRYLTKVAPDNHPYKERAAR